MPRELVTIQVGQCGNQIGRRFWHRALHEHAQQADGEGIYDEAMSSFFRNVDTRHEPPLDLAVGDGSGRIGALRARAILVDMEEGPVSQTLRDPIGELFEDAEIVTDVSGSGNNWCAATQIARL